MNAIYLLPTVAAFGLRGMLDILGSASYRVGIGRFMRMTIKCGSPDAAHHRPISGSYARESSIRRTMATLGSGNGMDPKDFPTLDTTKPRNPFGQEDQTA